MLIKNGLFLLVFWGALTQCTPPQSTQANQTWNGGLQIENGVNRGVTYTDSLGKTYNVRYIPITLTNESSLSMQIQIAFDGSDYLHDVGSEPFQVVPLPEAWALDGVEITDSLLDAIPKYIRKPFFSKRLTSGEKCLMAIATIYPRPAKFSGVLPSALFASTEQGVLAECDGHLKEKPSSNSSIALGLKLRLGESCVVIPSGQVSKGLVQEAISESKEESTGQVKLLRTQGSHEGDNVHCSLEDQAGNLWFGTTGEGVYQYEGSTFRQFTTKEGLSSNTIWCLLEDRAGRIWVGTDAGANVYEGERFSKIDIPTSQGSEWITSSVENEAPSKPLEIFSMMQDKSGKIWFATLDGVYIYDGQSFTPFEVDKAGKGFKNSEKNNVEYILEDDAGNIWFGGRVNAGVFRYDGKSIARLQLEELSGHDWAWPVLQDKHGAIWFSNWGGAYRYDGQSFTTFTTADGLLGNVVTRIMAAKDGNLWFACGGEDGGICRYDGEAFTCISAKEGPFQEGVWTLLEDRNGFLWLGTRNTGLYRYDGHDFTRYSDQ